MQFQRSVPSFLKESFKWANTQQIFKWILNMNSVTTLIQTLTSSEVRTAQTHFVSNIKETLAEIDLELKQILLKSTYYCHY